MAKDNNARKEMLKRRKKAAKEKTRDIAERRAIAQKQIKKAKRPK